MGSLRERLSWRTAARTIGGAALFALPSAVLAGGVAYEVDSQDTTIAGFDATVHLAADGYATFDARPLPSFRVPLDKPGNLGINVRINQSLAPNTGILVKEVSAVVAQPKGEEEKLREATKHVLTRVGETAALGGMGGVVLFGAIGSRRRRELTKKYGSKTQRVVLVGVLATACAASTTATASADNVHDIKWQNIQAVLPDVPAELSQMGIQLSSNVVSNKTVDLVRGMVAGYERSTQTYKQMEAKASQLRPELRQPEPGETVALLISDRHDNIGMDPVNAAIGKAGGADIVLDAGDDTSSGQDWEDFSLASLVANFKEFKHRVGVTGNHDFGSFVGNYLSRAKNGFTMLDHRSVSVDGLRIMGYADIRSSSLVNSADFATTDLTQLKQQITKETCDLNAAGKRVNILLIHQASIAEAALQAGCVDTVVGGHLHRYVGPSETTGVNGESGYSFTTDTAGGAALSMALGPLRRSAGVTLITFDTSGATPHLVGFQKVISTQSGEVLAQPFESVETNPTDSIPANLTQEIGHARGSQASESRRVSKPIS